MELLSQVFEYLVQQQYIHIYIGVFCVCLCVGVCVRVPILLEILDSSKELHQISDISAPVLKPSVFLVNVW